MSTHLSVSAIHKGTVIDHIPAGFALPIIELFNFNRQTEPMTIGLNLTSQRMPKKDIIKLENRFLSLEEINQIGIFAAGATVNNIENFLIVKKAIISIPASIERILPCPNPRCITQIEKMPTFFYVYDLGAQLELHCKYCEKTFARKMVISHD